MNKIFLVPWLIILLFVITGCPHYRLQIPSIHHDEHGWKMYGGCIERNNYSHESIIPPLDSLWEYDSEAGFSHSPAVASGNFLFVGNLRGEIHAVNIGTGRKAGVYHFGSSVIGTPCIDGDTVYVAVANDEDGLTAYNLTTGKIQWQAPIGDIETCPLLLDNKILITTLNGKLICLNKSTGGIIWTNEITSERKTKFIHSSPASDGNVIVFGTDGGILYAVDVKGGQLRWSTKTNSCIVASPAISNGRIFVGSTDSLLHAFDISNGKQFWSRNLHGKIYSSQAIDENHIYATIIGREVYCLNSEDGSLLWKTNVGGIVNSTPLLSGNILYIGTLNKTILALDAVSGSILWKLEMGGRIKSMPVVFKKRLFVFTEDRSVVCFGESKR